MSIGGVGYVSPGEAGRRGFEDLECYQLGMEVMVQAHEFAKSLPPEEKYDLAAQIRRSSKSTTANLAEGYGRYHYLDTLRFYAIARGSLNETLAHFINARALGYLDQATFEKLYHLTRRAEKALNGYMAYVRKQRQGHELFGDRLIKDESTYYDVKIPELSDHSADPLI